ncbi:hypothetical protein SDC9_169643 [bioreactor metagenome]|uniref:Uncharacterized protein n=1 Tax=bioreactor metagenome TaxID=1076179 RepID=A0A645G8E0_9ZZZZ
MIQVPSLLIAFSKASALSTIEAVVTVSTFSAGALVSVLVSGLVAVCSAGLLPHPANKVSDRASVDNKTLIFI